MTDSTESDPRGLDQGDLIDDGGDADDADSPSEAPGLMDHPGTAGIDDEDIAGGPA
ncbi:hypothetical protein [Planctomonas deserti]|jgi:hypothetical protein|uniref:hypothetical protein n=1 Tax=Planctomonas deserti TaxID=2144185 RepID=UPI00131F1ACE|nr:hypothetical protein [Planctomonas deserti]